MKSMLLLLLTLSAVNSLFIGTSKCTYGPSYWCANFANAKECSATQHCLKSYWRSIIPHLTNKDKLKESSCQLCKDIVSDVHKFISDNGTRAELLQYLSQACEFMPDTFSKTECNKVATHYLDEFLAALEAGVNPDVVCALLNLCNGSNKMPKDLSVGQSSNKFVATIKASSILKTAIERPVGSKKCTYGPSYWCANFANAKECSATQHCIDNDWKKTTSQSKAVHTVHEETVCTLCKNMIGDVHKFVADNGTRASIVDYIDQACVNFPDTFSQNECETLAVHYLDELLAAVEAQIDPEKICSLLWLCWNDTRSISANTAFQVKQDESECHLCTDIVNDLHKFIVDNEKEAEAMILEVVDAGCEFYMPSNYTAQLCEKTSKHYVEQLLTALADGVNPSVLCSKYSLCANDKVSSPDPSSVQIIRKGNLGETPCTLCKDLVSDIQDFISNNENETKEVIQPLLDDVCQCTMPDTYTYQECEKISAHYLDQLFSNVETALDPASVCSQAKLCKGLTKSHILPANPSFHKTSFDETVCDLCKDIATDVDKFMSNITAQQVVDLLDNQLCPQFGEFTAECKLLVEQYIPGLWKELLAAMQPEVLCSTICLCSSSSVLVQSSSVQCVLCEFALSKLDRKYNNKVEIQAAVGKVCSLLPAPLQYDCAVFMAKYSSDITNLLVDNVAPGRVCSMDGLKGLGMCSKI